MKRIIYILLMVITTALFISPLKNVSAQAETPTVVDTTIPVDAQILDDVNAWLATSAPVPFPYWAITYVGDTDESGNTFVSLVAIDIENPTDKWYLADRHLEDDHDDNVVQWMGSVIVRVDHSVDVYSDGGHSDDEPQTNFMKLAVPIFQPFGDGGGANVRFPWESGKSMMYGVRGIHAAGGGGAYATGFFAVDFLGGDELGPGVASNRVHAVANGEIDYVCDDDTTVTIRTENTETGDYYIYAHLLDNSTLIENYTYYQGDTVGYLKYGTFDDTCGWAQQQSTNYHLHFGFKPASGFFQMQSCILDMNSEAWACGSETITTGQFFRNYGSPISTGDDASAFSNQMSFWDYLLTGGDMLTQALLIDHLPDHQSNSYLYAIYNAINVTVRIARVVIYGNISLSWFILAITFALGVKAVIALAQIVAFVLKAWKSLIPIVGA